MKKLAILIVILSTLGLFAMALMWIALNILWKPEGPEDPTVHAAKVQAQLDEIYRQQRNAEFQQGLIQVVQLLIILIAAAIIIIFIVLFVKMVQHRQQMEIMKIKMDWYFPKYDPRGNPPLISKKLGEYQQFTSGNSDQPLPAHSITVAPGQEKGRLKAHEPTREYRAGQLSAIYLGDQVISMPDQRTLHPTNPPIEANAPDEPGSEPEPEPEFMQDFIAAIRRGESASKAIPEITGCSRNGKEPWNSYYLMWKEIEARIKTTNK
jgi:hypothetical protein